MGEIDIRLKEYIKVQYGSLSAFAKVIDMPLTTLDSILKRGVANSNISNVMKITDALNLSTDALADGRLEEKTTTIEIERLSTENKKRLTDYYEVLLQSQGGE